MPNDSHVIPVMIGDPVKCRMISDILLQDWGIDAQPIKLPTIPNGTERLRIIPSPLHSDSDTDTVADCLGMNALGSPRRKCALAKAVA